MFPLLILMENRMVKMKITIIELSGLNLCCNTDCRIPKMPTTAYFLLHFEVGRCQPKECQQAQGWRWRVHRGKGTGPCWSSWSCWSHVRVRVGRGDSVEPCWSVEPLVPQSASGCGSAHFRILLPAPSPVARPQPIWSLLMCSPPLWWSIIQKSFFIPQLKKYKWKWSLKQYSSVFISEFQVSKGRRKMSFTPKFFPTS